ncbi:uncharacterized protein LOC5514282 isoform X3 [Nematostella vectensis]|uniref:uncharacterized protein LOC5514282 isoform X3 n=1 Tax=Nematostella vectensis TaxID=45351 RepID=UPI00207711A8|nr:uncharacterized protein LOC5514282 isoform X3 [Nematostella vectensis]
MRVFLLLVLVVLLVASVKTEECRNYKVLNSKDRAQGEPSGNVLKCDQRDIPSKGWYRFSGAAGDRMPTHVVPKNHCGTHAPGWLNGANPSVAEGIVSRKVCFHWTSGDCQWSQMIRVRNCGRFYVYELDKTPACHLRFCGNAGAAPTRPPTTPPVVNECRNYKVLNSKDRAQGEPRGNVLKCDQRDIPSKGWYRFSGAAGDRMPTHVVPKNHCGTHAPGWLRGSNPSVAEGIVSRKVCFHWNSNACQWNQMIRVRNCGRFYVYELDKTPACNLRFCGNAGAAPTRPPTTPPVVNECRNYKVLNSKDRAQGEPRGNVLKCDQRDIPSKGWYRFSGAAGDRMPTHVVPKNHCGTHAPGWLRGSNPSVAEGIVSRKVCFHWNSNACQWNQMIRVRNCGRFYVYELDKTPACNLRFCGNAGAAPTRPPTTPPVVNECRNYKVLNSKDRAQGEPSGNVLKCDQRDIPSKGWYRFSGAAGDRMPTHVVPKNHCGTHAPGWLRGSNPSVAEGIVSRKVCFHWNSNACQWNQMIRVRNCGRFYVYELDKTPACNLRFCGNAGAAPTRPPTTPPVVNECRNYKVLNSKDRAQGEPRGNVLKCDQRDIPSKGWYRFSGAAGDRMPTHVVPKNHCGTHAPGWLRGSNPSVAEGIVSRKVCFHWTSGDCQWNQMIRVRNCGRFYVYELDKTPVCHLRFCGNAGAAPTRPPTTPPVVNECRNYKVLNSKDRAQGEPRGNVLKCDQRDIPSKGWYRFSGAAGDRMPTHVVPKNHCGTHAPGWLRGSNPSVAEGIVSRKVCFHWNSNACQWNQMIRVRNCGRFYVYELDKTPACNLRFCGNAGAAPTRPPTTPPVVNECRNYKVLNSKDRAQGEPRGNVLKCDQRDIPSKGWYRFSGAAGDRMPTHVVPKNHCGTHAPGWLRGSNPSVAEGIVSRKVCFHWNSNACQWNQMIRVRNCGRFYVYELDKTPACNLRFCGNAGAAPTRPPTTPPVVNECRNYKVLNSKDRAQGEPSGNVLKCDQRDIPSKGWYRFSGAAGDRMPTHVVPKNHCGTHAPGWLRGSNPSVAEGIVSRKVCFHWNSNACQWNQMIRVRNCGRFYVYELDKTPACNLRFCGNAGAAPTRPPTTPPVVNECRNYKVLNSKDRAQGEPRGNVLKCDQRDIPSKGWYRFSGAAGDRMPTHVVPKNHCGTHAPGWLRGSNPSVAEGIVSRKVCFHWTSGDCQWNQMIRVRNCGRFYVYELDKTPVCHLRFCGNAGAAPTRPPTTPPVVNECRNYKVLNSKDRAQGEPRGNVLKCDQRDIPSKGWYRFSGAAGDRMPTHVVPKNHCGTHAPGWLRGSNPSVAEGIVSRKVCFHWTSGDCQWNQMIRVRNCGRFYVYELDKTPVCHLRFCGNAGAAPTRPPTTPPVVNECRNYKVLNSKDRAQGEPRGNVLKCDQRDIPSKGWYRFSGAAGDRMPTHVVPKNHCGTHAPGWLRGSNPSVAEGIVSRKVCFHWTSGDCQWNQMIRVRNCGRFYVYELDKTPVCHLRFCGNAGAAPTRPPTTPPVVNECRNYKVLNSKDRAQGEPRGNVLKCDQRDIPSKGWYRFSGAAGDRMPTHVVPKNHCGTHAPGWLRGSNPSVAEGIVSRKVCFHWTSGDCQWNQMIRVRNCGRFYVYELDKTPVCHLRFCGNAGAAPTRPPTTPPVVNECRNYKVLNSKDRAQGEPSGNVLKCDKNDIPSKGWYRFSGAAGDRMPTHVVPVHRCGTHAPGYLNGSNPSVAEGIVSRKVCFNWRSICQWSQMIRVKNCGRFYVYELDKTPVCHLRFCGNAGAAPTRPPTTPPVVNECRNYKVLNSKDRAQGEPRGNVLKCDKNDIPSKGWYRFSGAAGDRMPTHVVPVHRCGTHAPGYLNGSNPSVAEGIVSRKVCFNWRSICQWSQMIRVKNCGRFYVYELDKTPTCSLRFCGNAGAAPTTPPPTTPPVVNECRNYKVLNSKDRAQGEPSGNVLKCDQRDIPSKGWYRFSGAAGDRMPTHVVPKNHCGTHAPGWLRGSNPSVAEGIVSRKVCFHWTSGDCQWSQMIRVRNCGRFYVYELDKTPACHLRFCGNAGAAPTTPPTTPPVVNECRHYQILNSPDRAQGQLSNNVLRCDRNDIKGKGWYRFTGAAGNAMPTKCVPIRRCGTHAPGWMVGRQPSPIEGRVRRTVCFNWAGNCCKWRQNILVRNCGHFLVYELDKTPACHLRFCGNAGGLPPPPTTVRPPFTRPNKCHVLRSLLRALRQILNKIDNVIRQRKGGPLMHYKRELASHMTNIDKVVGELDDRRDEKEVQDALTEYEFLQARAKQLMGQIIE